MKEKDFQSEVTRSILWLEQQLGEPLHYMKIPDAPMGPNARFASVKGYDAFLVHRGRFIALELKLSKGPSISFDRVNDVQDNFLSEVVQAGGLAWILVNFRVTWSQREIKRRSELGTISAFAVPIQQWLQTRADAMKGSLSYSWFETEAVRLPKIKTERGIGWDLRPILPLYHPLCRIPEPEVATCP